MGYDWQSNQGDSPEPAEGSDANPSPRGAPGFVPPADPNGTQILPPPGYVPPADGPPYQQPYQSYRQPPNQQSYGGYGPAPPGPGAQRYGGYPPPAPPPPPGYGYSSGGYLPGYGYSSGGYLPGYGYAAPRTDGTAIAALVLAITSFVICPVVLAIVALALIPGSRRSIAASGGTAEGLGLLTAAKVIAWINIGLAVVGFVAFIIAVSSSSSGALTGAFIT